MVENENKKNVQRGRGAVGNQTGRFDHLQIEPPPLDLQDTDQWFHDDSKIKTIFYRDSSRSIVNENDSPDIGFRYSMNFYRGCEHGCAYCYARPTHEYLGMSAGLDFESKIFVKENAPDLLREKLMSKNWQPECIMVSGVTDCYQPAEARFRLTRQCLEVLEEFRQPAGLITKNHLVARDIDVLKRLAEYELVVVYISVTTLDTELARVLEPRTSTPEARLRAIRSLSEAGIPVGVNVAPVIPGLTDHEMPSILKAAAEAGAWSAGYVPLRLPYSVSSIFTEWLEQNRPLAKERVLHLIRDMRGGKINDSNFGSRMRGQGEQADNLRQMFHLFCKKYGLNQKTYQLRTDLFQRPGDQLSLL
ncbi:MAG: PA0069 family radical SAM protein [Bdellovibrionales bacterium]